MVQNAWCANFYKIPSQVDISIVIMRIIRKKMKLYSVKDRLSKKEYQYRKLTELLKWHTVQNENYVQIFESLIIGSESQTSQLASQFALC